MIIKDYNKWPSDIFQAKCSKCNWKGRKWNIQTTAASEAMRHEAEHPEHADFIGVIRTTGQNKDSGKY